VADRQWGDPIVMFGLSITPSAASGTDPVGEARLAESLGFDFVSANDHVHGSDPRHELWTMLSWIAAGTSRIRVAPRVLGVPYRHPTMVAKMAETFDRLSGGRLILGLGGGYSDEEFRALGLGERSPRQKVEGLEDAIRITRGLWSEHSFTYDGGIYRTRDARIEPKPDRHIPIWLGTYGPRALALTGQLADGWIPTYELALPEQVTAMRDRIMRSARDAGRDPDEITCVYNIDVTVDGGAEASPSVLAGSPDALVERMIEFTGLGFTAFNFHVVGPGAGDQAAQLARDVIPSVRSAA
jgi:alkanesulfonate monooxygenase SsuD/methylene tetrahydromethanopterin reductase-like flavin-dependent oxidoreductase (luciferase family)